MPLENTPFLLLIMAFLSLAFASGYVFSSKRNIRGKNRTPNVRPNVTADFNTLVKSPAISPNAYIDPQCSIIGNVHIGREVYVGPFASVRGDEGQPIRVGDYSNIQDGVVLHALETEHGGKHIEKNLFEVDGVKHALYIGNSVSLAHQCQVHGPAVVGDNTFVGMQSFIFRARVGKNVVIEPGALVIGVTVPDGCYVPAGKIVTTPEAAKMLPAITESYALKDINSGALHVNKQLAGGYLKTQGTPGFK